MTVTRRGAGAGIVRGTEMKTEIGKERAARTKRSAYAFDVRALSMKNIVVRRGLLLPISQPIAEMATELERTVRLGTEERRGGNRRICIRREGVVEAVVVVVVARKVDMGMAEVEVGMEVVGTVAEGAIISRGMCPLLLFFILYERNLTIAGRIFADADSRD